MLVLECHCDDLSLIYDGWKFALDWQLNPDLVWDVAGVERYSAMLGPVFKIFLRTSTASWHWDTQLKQNGVFEERFAQSYAEKLN